jgi:hypothetical protein
VQLLEPDPRGLGGHSGHEVHQDVDGLVVQVGQPAGLPVVLLPGRKASIRGLLKRLVGHRLDGVRLRAENAQRLQQSVGLGDGAGVADGDADHDVAVGGSRHR